MTEETTEQRLCRLTEEWKLAKAAETTANRRRVEIESDIWASVHNEVPEKGTFTLDTGMKIVTGFTEEWDQEKLADAARNWSAPVPFPFDRVFKADAKAVNYVRESLPEAYKQIQDSLTLKSKKPGFSIKENS